MSNGLRFQTPPGWPAPPAGWVPPASWVPDLSWPPPRPAVSSGSPTATRTVTWTAPPAQGRTTQARPPRRRLRASAAARTDP